MPVKIEQLLQVESLRLISDWAIDSHANTTPPAKVVCSALPF